MNTYTCRFYKIWFYVKFKLILRYSFTARFMERFILYIIILLYTRDLKNEKRIFFRKKIYLYRLSYVLNQPISHSSPFSGRSFVFTLVYHNVRPLVKTSLNWNTSQPMYSVRTISLERFYIYPYEINKITINFFRSKNYEL